ncbi:MAG: TROVE domain-containing protein [Paludibacteraceae bacterium]|nr:TROVE domain-containing protein [Paludibacteraceae bacterium]
MNFNSQLKPQDVTRNHEGAIAYTMTPEMELYTAIVTSMLNDTYYESSDERVKRIQELVGKVSPLFVAQLAVYARREMNLRSVPLLLLTLLAKVNSTDTADWQPSMLARAIEMTVLRADEISELLACYQLLNPRQGRKQLSGLSHQVQKGLQTSFNRLDEYQFAKYDRSSQTVRLRDALFLVHPKAKDEAQQQLFNKIASQSLQTPYTWETELSELGKQPFDTPEQKQAAVRAKWEELIDSGKLGYMALLRNLRNIVQSEVSKERIDSICARLSNKDEVAHSKQLPFRFFSAYKEMLQVMSPYTSLILTALEEAAKASAPNTDLFGKNDRILLACDLSGSMQHSLSPKSKVQLYEVGILLAMLMQNTCQQVQTGLFGDIWKPVNLPQTNILQNTNDIRKRIGEVGYCTNGYIVIDWLIENKQVVDKVMFFTDCQLWDDTYTIKTVAKSWQQYKQIAPDARLYMFDLAGYGESPLRLIGKDVCLVAGWSERIFQMVETMEKGEDIMTKIKQVKI